MPQQQDYEFQQIEGKLYWYFEAERELELMRGQEERIESNRMKLIGLRYEYIEACAYQGAKAQYASEHVQGKKSIYSNPIEPAVNAMDDLQSEIDHLFDKQISLLKKIPRKEKEMAMIRMAIECLSRMDRDICEYKYRHKMSLDEIARLSNLSKGAVRHRREKIVRHVADRLEAGV